MERSRSKILQLAIVVLFALLTSQQVSSQKCNSNYNYERCTVQSLKINSSDLGSLKFPVYSNIELTQAEMDYLSPEVVLRMKWVSNLTITNGRVDKIFLKHDLQKLVATNSKTYDVIIDDGENEDLEQLVVTSNLLQSIPENVGNLRSLVVLDLNRNKIETVDLGELHGLRKLRTVDLSYNRIYYLEPIDSLELTRLETLKLGNNFLTELDFQGWNVPQLRLLHIEQNSLTYTNNFNEESFPSLREYTDSSNVFDCRWRAEFILMLPKWTNFNRRSFPNDCVKSVQLSSATYRMLNMSDVRNYTFDFDSKEQLQKQISAMIETEQKQSQQIGTLTKLVTELLERVTGELHTQQLAMDGLQDQIALLWKEVADLKQQQVVVVPAGRTVPKGFREKLIQEVVDVLRRNLVEVED